MLHAIRGDALGSRLQKPEQNGRRRSEMHPFSDDFNTVLVIDKPTMTERDHLIHSTATQNVQLYSETGEEPISPLIHSF